MSINKILKSDVTASWKQIPKCSICFKEFTISGIPGSRRRPLILSCYHNVCEPCAYNAGRNRAIHYLKCNECNEKTMIDRYSSYRQIFQFNYYLNGLVYYAENLVGQDISMQNSFSNAQPEIELKNGGNQCAECNRKSTDQYCVQCNVPFCLECFKDIHQMAKTLKKHNLATMPKVKNILLGRSAPKKCAQHKQPFDRFCLKCKQIFCGPCSPIYHFRHPSTSLTAENKKYFQQISNLIETVKLAKTSTCEAIKDTRFVENRIDDFATESIERLSKYFGKLHSVLQVTETNVLQDIKKGILNSIQKTKEVNNTFQKTTKQLDDLIIALENIVEQRPNVLLSTVIEKTNRVLESIPCQVKFENFEKCPFVLSPVKQVDKLLESCVNFKNVDDCKLKVNLTSYFGDVATDIENAASAELTNKTADIEGILNQDVIVETKQILKHKSAYLLEVVVSFINSPHEFYVQEENCISEIRELNLTCKDEATIATTPEYIELDELYLVQINDAWYRGKILSALSNNVYQTFLVDYGATVDVTKQCVREMCSNLKQIRLIAMKCSIYGVKPKNKNWTEGAGQIMNDLIENQQLRMVVIQEGETNLVDLITRNHFPISIRDALIFTDFADIDNAFIDKKDTEIKYCLQYYNDTIKNNFIPKITQKFYKGTLTEALETRIVGLNVISPEEFYVTKYENKPEMESLSMNMNESYSKSAKKIYKPMINMLCAVCLKGKWYRAKVIEIEEKVKCKVWLVDYGCIETITWKQMRILDEKYLEINEFAFECSLIDIEPLQMNNYAWTPEAIAEFKLRMKHSTLQIVVHSSKEFRHKVTLYIVKNTVDLNVNSLMVEYGHAVSTGIESMHIERPKLQFSLNTSKKTNLDAGNVEDTKNLELEKTKLYESPSKTNAKSSGHQTKIRITHIVSPGEFYIHLQSHLTGIMKLHKDIQISQSKRVARTEGSEKIKSNWKIGENCLVRTRSQGYSQLEWYRAIINDVDHENMKYTVFLRDRGEKINNISSDNMMTVENVLFNRILNSAIKCHMACVQPTGGLTHWSHSSIDQLKNLNEEFTTITASIQGERKNESIPVILWGMTNKIADPLAPNILNWVNINKMLVNFGLAHLCEKFDKNKQNQLNEELAMAKKSLDEWLLLVDKVNIEQNAKLEVDNKMDSNTKITTLYDTDNDLENFLSWLPANPIEKTLFTAIPTYVDDNGTIYLHDAENKEIFDEMRNVINRKVEDIKKNKNYPKYCYWYSGQPCLALFHLDSLYYRAQVVCLRPNNVVQVCFVDYGNVEECPVEDLIKEVCLTKIPIQAIKYDIEGIIPNTPDKKWTRDSLDFIHNAVVTKLCGIRVAILSQYQLIKKCSIKVGRDNLAELLIENKYAIKHSDVFKKTVSQNPDSKLLEKALNSDIIRQFLSSDSFESESNRPESDDEKDILLRAAKQKGVPEKQQREPGDYKKFFEKRELEKLYSTIMSDKEVSDDFLVDLDYTAHSGAWCHLKGNVFLPQTADIDQEEENIPISSGSAQHKNTKHLHDLSLGPFDPKETSTVVSRLEGLDCITRSQLPYGLNGFYCEIAYIRNAKSFYVYPKITEHEKCYVDLERRIQMYVKTAPALADIEPNSICLAIYEDKLWYRALIRKHHLQSGKVDVIYVDFLNSATISVNEIRKCAKQLLEIPLRLILVKLNGLKENPRWRKSDIMIQLSETLSSRRLYAKVIKHGKIPEVDFLVSHNNDSLVLDTLIKNKLFLKDDHV